MNKKKTIVLVGIVILVIIAAIIGICIERSKSNINSNIPNNVNSGENITNNNNNNNNQLPTTYIEGEKTLDNLTFKNIKVVSEGENQCVFEADVSNSGDEKVDSTVLNVELINGSGDSIGVLGVELPEVDSKSTSKIRMSIAVDVMHTRDVEIKFAE